MAKNATRKVVVGSTIQLRTRFLNPGAIRTPNIV